MAQVTVNLFARIPPELNKLLEKRVADTGDSKNKIVTEALDKYLRGGVPMRVSGNETQVLREIAGQEPTTAIINRYDWRDYYPVVGDDGKICGLMDAQNAYYYDKWGGTESNVRYRVIDDAYAVLTEDDEENDE